MDDDDDDCSNWSELHEDMIHLIFKKLTSAADCFRFGSVCVSWRSISFAAYLHPGLLHPQLPLLMIPTPPQPTTKEEEEEEKRSFYSVLERSVYKDIKISLPHNRNCRGSSHGWIITTSAQDYPTYGYSVEMFNPFISVINNEYQKIQLPPLTDVDQDLEADVRSGLYNVSRDYLYKAIVSVNPSSHPRDYVVMILYGTGGMARLGFWRPGDQVWTDVDSDCWSCPLDDVIYHKGQDLFYAVDDLGKVTVIDLNGGAPSVTRLDVAPRPILAYSGKKYLVESAGDLLVVGKGGSSSGLDEEDSNYTVFKVFKLIMTEINGTYKWEVLNTLPGRMLFLGDNASISLATSDFPGGKSSCIYFTDDYAWVTWLDGEGGSADTNDDTNDRYLHSGIFSMEEDKTIERFRPIGEYFSPVNSIWVEPTLRCCFRL